MKKKHFLFILIFLALVVGYSCNNKGCFDVPFISIDKSNRSAITGDTVVVTITLSSTVDLISIQACPSAEGLKGTTFLPDAKLFEAGTQNFIKGKYGAVVKYRYIVSYTINEIAITFQVTDKNSTNIVVCKISVANIPPPTSTIMVKMGGGNNMDIGSFFSCSTGVVFIQADALKHSDLIDFFYYFDSSAGFYSANNKIINGKYTGWAAAPTKNTTGFVKTTITPPVFDAISTDDSLIKSSAALATDDFLTNLNVGDVIAFKTGKGLMGLIKIVEIKGNNFGTISFVSKVQRNYVVK